MNTFLAIGRTLFFILLSYKSLMLIEAVLGTKPLRSWLRFLLSVINSVISTYLVLFTSFRFTYLAAFALLLIESVIVFRRHIIKLICLTEAYILFLMCMRGITTALFALFMGLKINEVIGSSELMLLTSLIPNVFELLVVIGILHYVSAADIQLPLKYTVQRRYILFWLTIYILFMMYGAEIYNPGSRLFFAVYEYLCLCVFILLSSLTMPMYTFRLNRAIEIQKKNRSLSLELGNQKRLQSALIRDALFTSEANLTQNRVIRGLEVYSDTPPHVNDEFDAWFEFVKTRIHPEDVGVFSDNMERHSLLENYYHGVEPLPFEYRRLGDDGEYHWVRLVIRIFKDVESGDVLVFGYAFDIENAKREKLELEFRAQTDLFTGLYNKATTEALISEEIKRAPGILLLLDVDNLKNVNDRLGHEFGDSVLKYVACVMKNCSREDDILGRIGGDEFMIFMKNTNNASAAEKRAIEILSLLKKGADCRSRKQSVTASIGIAPTDSSVKSFSDAYNRADIALYQVKRSNKNGYAVYGTESFSEVVS